MSDAPSTAGAANVRHRRKRLGEMLLDQGLLSQAQLEELLERQKTVKGTRLGRLVVDMGYATEVQVTEAIAEQLRIPAADLAAVDVPADLLARVEPELARKHLCVPWFVEDRELYLIMADPTDIDAIDAVAFHTGHKVKPVVAPESEVAEAVRRFYAGEESSLALFENLDLAEHVAVVTEDVRKQPEREIDETAAGEAPVVKLVSAILADAIASGASDVHIEPQQKEARLRYRVDGMLRPVMTLSKRVHQRAVSRIKILSHMDISERRKPQDGRTFVRVGPQSYDLRVSSLPTADGEKIVMRILAQERARVALDQLGFESDTLESFRDLLRRPQGMILVTGPTGAGKTSTLYAALNFLVSETTNIVTVEDPVEYRLEGVNQVAVSERGGTRFADGLRSILRQDPDVIMVGEIRDLETAQVAFQAAQTGHLVLSTLHTNDAPSTVTRLVEMGVPIYVVASSLVGVMAQRLARRLCECKKPLADGAAEPVGCERCRFSGYKGRLGLYEQLRLTPRVRSVILTRASEDVIRNAARAGGMKTVFEDGLRKVAHGHTTLEEVRRVAPPDEEAAGSAAPEPAAAGEASAEEALSLPPGLSAEARAARPARILVVEDDPGLRESLKDTLESEHYEVITAADGREALAHVYRARPDLVLTDLRMPGMTGLDLLRRLRHNLSTCQIPVVFLTVVEEVGTEALALDLGADDYIAKPVERTRLLGRIRRSLVRTRLLRV